MLWKLHLKLFMLWGGIRKLLRLSKKFYLAPDGDDEADGLTWATRKRTVQAVEQVVRPGDIVCC